MRKISLIVLLLSALQLCGQTLHYDRPARYFEEALVIGNGTLGGTIYGGYGCDSITLNDITLWTGEPDSRAFDSIQNAAVLEMIRQALEHEDYRAADSLQRRLQGHYSENYQPLGTLKLNFHQDSARHYARWLDLSTAVAGHRANHLEVSYFCSHPDQVMVVRVHGTEGFMFEVSLDAKLPHHTAVRGREIVSDGYAAYHSLPQYTYQPQMFWYDSARGIHYRTIVRVVGGSVSADGTGIKVSSERPGDVYLIIANATSFNGFDKDPVREGADYKQIVRDRVDKAAARSYGQLLRRHKRDYRRFYGRVKIDLGATPSSVAQLPTDEQLFRYTENNEFNPDLEELYFQFGRYLLISCSRTNGVPATLQGLWNEHLLPPWSSNYTCNINLEENYWLAEAANLSEMHLPLLAFLKNLQTNGTYVARQVYGVNQGWCSCHNSDIWAMANPVGYGADDPVWANWNMGGTWLSTHIWEHYRYTLDTAFLREYYPILRAAASFCLNWLVEKDGCLLTMPCTSPENKFRMPDGYCGPTFYGGTADMAMIRECLHDAGQAAAVLGADASFAAACDSVIGRLAPYKIGSNGQLLEWYHDWADADPTHRHQSHLFGLYPGHSIDPHNDTALVDACRKTLALRGPESTGWSTGWRVNLYARMADGDAAYAMFRRLLRYVSPDGYSGADAKRGGGTYPNMLDSHSPFQIDGNFGGCAGICELLQQLVDHPEALPKAWHSGSVDGIRLPGNKTLSVKWRNGKVVKCRVKRGA